MSTTAAIVIGVAVLLAWDNARAQPTGVMVLGAANNNPFRLIRANEVIPRLAAWLDYGGALLGPAPLTALFVSMGYTIDIDGLSEAEANPNLMELFIHQAKPEFVYRQRGRSQRRASSSPTTTASSVGAAKCVPCW